MASNGVGGTLWPLVRALQEVPILASLQDRIFFVRLLSDRLGPLSIEESPLIQRHLFNIVEVCESRSDGMRALIEVLGELDGGTVHYREVAQIVADRDADALWPEEERERLFALLSGMIFTDLVELYREVAGVNAPELPAETTYREVFLTLETLNADADGLPKPIVFVEHLAYGRRPELSTELRRWSDRQASRLSVITELQALRRAFRAPPPGPAPNEPAYVVLLLRRVGLSGELYQLDHWSQIDLSEGWHPGRGAGFTGTLDEVKRQVAVLLEEVEAKWARYQPDIRIEVVLPAELLNLDVDQWTWEVESSFAPVPLGCRYSFAIRSLERMRAAHWHRYWHARWTVLTGQTQLYGAIDEESARRGERGDGIRNLVADFENNPKLVSLTLSAPPDGSESGGAEVAVGLRAGVPIMVWHRSDCDSEEFLTTVHEVLHGDGPGVLQRVKQVRTTAYRSHPEHVGHNLAVLWDDPQRLVVLPDPRPPREVVA